MNRFTLDLHTIGMLIYKLEGALWFAEDPACKDEEWSVLREIVRLIGLLQDEGGKIEKALEPLSDLTDSLDDSDLPCDIVE